MEGQNDISVEDSIWFPNSLDNETTISQYHYEWRNYLNGKNRIEVNKLGSMPHCIHRFSFFSRHTVNFFFQTAKILGMPPEVPYVAIDLQDRVWVMYSDEEMEWHCFLKYEQFKKEKLLMAFSCLQIASKLCCASKILSVSVIIQSMENFGYSVDKKSVVQSELSILKRLNCVLPNVTVLTYVEMFLENMMNLLSFISRSELLTVAVKVINVSFTFHQEIYQKLQNVLANNGIQSSSERKRFMCIQGDAIRLAASVLWTSTMLLDPSENVANAIIDYLSTTTSYPAEDVLTLGQIMFHIVLRGLKRLG